MEKNFLGEEAVSKLLIKLSVPASIAILVTMLYCLVDAYFIGHGVGVHGIGSLAITQPFNIFIMSISMLFGVGSASIISRSLGARDFERVEKVAGTALLIAFILSTLLAVFGYLYTDELLVVFGATHENMQLSKNYFRIIIFGAPFLSLALSMNSLVQAEGKAKFAMKFMLVSTIANIILDPIFIFSLNMKMQGAALATVIGQIIWFMMIFSYFIRKKSNINIKVKNLRLDLSILKDVSILGLPTFIRQAGGSLLMIIINKTLIQYGGAMHVAVMGIIMRMIRITLVPMAGIAQGFKPIVGYNFGAEKIDRVKEVLKKSLIISVSSAFIGFLIMELSPEKMIQVFSPNREIVTLGAPLLQLVVLVLPLTISRKNSPSSKPSLLTL